MPHINDAADAAMPGAGALNDQVLAYCKANGATGAALNDTIAQFLVARGQAARHVNDMWGGYMTVKGFTGQVNDAKLKFWAGGGVA